MVIGIIVYLIEAHLIWGGGGGQEVKVQGGGTGVLKN